MTLRKKVLFYTLLTFFTLAGIEGMARLAYYFAFAESYPPTPPTLSAAAADLAPAEPTDPVRLDDGFYDKMNQHPYYGYTPHFPNSPLNVVPPAQTRSDTVLIGLLGGSLARDVAPYLQQALTQYFADQDLAKEPVVVPLTHGGMKQPQQLHIAAFILAMGGSFDILVNLDGFNELNGSYINFSNAVFPSFPVNWKNLVSLTRDEIALAGQIHATRGQLAQLQQAATASPIRYTALYGILNRYQLQQAQTRILQLNYELSTQETARSLERHGPYVPFQNISQVRQEAVQVWYRSSALLSRLAATAGADYYHFLQPNQYIPNSKPLSLEERRYYYNPEHSRSTDYANTYPLLVQFGQELQQQGVHYSDLTSIFNDHPETLYYDACCHLNRRGLELLAAAMVQSLAPTLRRRSVMLNPAPAGPLTAAAAPRRPPTPPTPPALRISPENLTAEPDFQVSRRPGNLLLYTKENCAPAHIAALFFLHITPADPSALPPARRRHGFASRDFPFQDGGVRSGSGLWHGRNCVIARRLPDYPIAQIRTGQFNPAGEIWATELAFSQ